MATPNERTIAELVAVLAALDPPLKLRDMPRTPLRRRLMQLHAELALRGTHPPAGHGPGGAALPRVAAPGSGAGG